jgi:hypothetical protein
VRGIFFDADDARAVAARLERDGWTVDLRREPLAGEDDDEDHPWAVTTDAPSFVLDVLVDTYDGWLEADPGEEPPRTGGTVPLDLPTAPRRIKRSP